MKGSLGWESQFSSCFCGLGELLSLSESPFCFLENSGASLFFLVSQHCHGGSIRWCMWRHFVNYVHFLNQSTRQRLMGKSIPSPFYSFPLLLGLWLNWKGPSEQSLLILEPQGFILKCMLLGFKVVLNKTPQYFEQHMKTSSHQTNK